MSDPFHHKLGSVRFFLFAITGAWALFNFAQPSWAASEHLATEPSLPILQLSLRNAMTASVEYNQNIRLFQERMTQAQDNANTQLGALLPNISGQMSRARRRLFFGSFGRDPIVADPDRLYEARALLTQNLFSLSLIHQWRAARSGVEVAGLNAKVTKHNTMATVGLMYFEVLRALAIVEAREADVGLNTELLRLTAQRKKAGMATS